MLAFLRALVKTRLKSLIMNKSILFWPKFKWKR